jgi:nitrogen fixation protein FixH
MQEITGQHVFAITAGAFGVIIGVNAILAWKAVSTFPGVEVASSYAAGVGFDARRAAQEALGWEVTARYQGGRLQISITDVAGPVQPQALTVALGRATAAGQDQTAALTWDGQGWSGEVPLSPGLWRVDVAAVAADGTAFARQLRLRVGS